MDLKKKLALLGSPRPSAAAAPPPVSAPAPVPAPEVATPAEDGRVDRLRRALSTLPPRAARANEAHVAASRALPAEARETPHGTVFLREALLEPDHRHGSAPVRGALDADASLVSALALDPSLREVDPRGMLLLDTETTGLAGGTGTLPFVLGLAWFEGDRLRVAQLLLRRPGEEAPMLQFLTERLQQATCLVSYNGKTFDWPLLRNRFVMNRLKVPAPRPHVDLLHCARRVYRHRVNGARLVQLEEEILGYRRVGDVPGDQIPELYFRYLRTGQGGLLAPVLEHNAQDMVLLAALLGVLAREFHSATADDPRDRLGYASVAARAGDLSRALQFAQGAACAEDRNVCVEALTLAANVARRAGDDRVARDALERAVTLASGHTLAVLHLELAKLYEHRLADLPRALDHARHTLLAEGGEAHRKRMERLERRLSRTAAKHSLPLL